MKVIDKLLTRIYEHKFKFGGRSDTNVMSVSASDYVNLYDWILSQPAYKIESSFADADFLFFMGWRVFPEHNGIRLSDNEARTIHYRESIKLGANSDEQKS